MVANTARVVKRVEYPEPIKQLVAQQHQLTDQVNAARQSVSGIETGLTKRVVANEKAIEAIDAYRLQLNSRLVDLQTRVDSVAAPKGP